MQRACAILPSVACNALQYFPTLSHTGTIWFAVQLLVETFLILRRNEQDMIKLYIGRSAACTVPVIGGRYDNNCISVGLLHVQCRLLVAGMIITVYRSVCMYTAGYWWQVWMKLEFSRQIFEKSSNVTKIRPVGAEWTDGRSDWQTAQLFHAVGRTVRRQTWRSW
jgi:hypothetical protein